LSAKAWDEKGLYADCPLCIKLLGAVVSSTLKAPLKEQQCIRREVGKAVVRESQQCLQSKNIDFHIPPTPPDLEESSSAFLDNVATAISDYVHIHNKLYSCGLESKSTASKTVKCLRKPFPRYLPTHCEALHQCDQQVPSSCTASINIVKKSMCACLHNVRHEVVKRFETLDSVIRQIQIFRFNFQDNAEINQLQLVINAHNGPAFGPGSSLDTCAASIKGHMSTTVNNWFAVIDQALELCIQTKPLQGLLTMDSLVTLGCKTILKHRNEQSKTELIRAFVMVGNYVDALSDRSSRFCGPHC
uniref:Saposin B-type domain-containing protein n=1 Tax=Anisakis simplex TaxID=6269 RepID=A0A0M3IZQ5_ANISI